VGAILNIRCRNCQNPPLRRSNSAAAFFLNAHGVASTPSREQAMRILIGRSLAAGVSALALAGIGLHGAKAADMAVQGQYQPPPPAYGPPPAEESYAYPPPPVAYGYPPPPVAYYAYAPPPYAVVPGPYYAYGPYMRGYGHRYAYGYGHYGHWGHGYRR
jgi:hypothetical protein